ncbi:MAG: hypothetical protein ACN6O6_06615 [Pseudomonas sp.]|uniref:hypothetical protein n=1 Tax=Pseudomonas sp. TaxID=306 RepID=UPI003D128E47
MNRIRQAGQSMTEYMVVLGVTGAALLAATTDVGTLFDNVKRGYQTQSSEMNRVQQYDRFRVSFNPNESGEDDYDDGDTPPPEDSDQPAADEQLPTVEWVYDENGKMLGKMDGDMLVDAAGNVLAWCRRTETGDCVFVDENGNIIYGGASSTRQWVDENGNELPLMAMTSGGKIYGFAYLYKNKYYSAGDRKLLNPQPTGLTAQPMRRVVDLDSKGVPQTAGYELGGKLYSVKSTLQLSTTFEDEVGAEKDELVSVEFLAAPNDNWEGYAPCLVMPGGWSESLPSPPIIKGSGWDKKFDDPSLRVSLGGQPGVGGFVNGATAADCRGRTTVTYDPATKEWSLKN